jgi:outer membrane immunogenic protein
MRGVLVGVDVMRGSVVVTVFCGCVLAACVARAGWAADLEIGVPAPKPVVYVSPYFNWEGIYIGAFAGGGFSSAKWAVGSVGVPPTGATTILVPGTQYSVNGVVGGGRLGMNFQSEAWVWGFEGDFTGMHLTGSGTDGRGDQYQTTANWSAQIAMRAGYAFYNLLLYGKAGAAVEQDREKITYVPPPPTIAGLTSGTATRFGFLLGTGLEYGFDRHWSANIEYQYIWAASQLINFTPLPGSTAAAPTLQRNLELNVQRVIAGVNYRFY